MDTVLNIHVASLDPDFVEDLRKQFGGAAELEIHVKNAPDQAEWLGEKRFWEIIGLFDWSKTGDSPSVVKPAVEALSKMPVSCIHQFEDIMAEKLWLLDTQKHGDAYLGKDKNAHFSVDSFLYGRCCVVANGQSFFEKVLKSPSEWPAKLSFSYLLNVASDAFELKTGRRFVHIPKHNYETYSNEKGWD